MPSPRKTRPKNAKQRPGLVTLPTTKRRTTAEVKADKEAKKAAKEAKTQAKKDGIQRAAAFESAAIVNEDLMDATPRPKFNAGSSSLVTGAEMAQTEASSDDEMSDKRNLDQNDHNPPEDLADNDLTDSEGCVEQTPISKKRKLALNVVDNPAAKVHKQQLLRRTYAFTNILAAHSHGEHESGNESECQTRQQSQSTGDVSPEDADMDIYVSDDPATAEQPAPRRSFTVADSAVEGPGHRQGKARGGAGLENRQQTQKVTNRGLPAKLMDNVTDDFPAERNSGPPVKKVKTKGMEEVEEKKTKKKKESIRDAIEAVQGKTIDNVSRKQPSHDDNTKGKKVTIQKGKEGRMTPEKATRSDLLLFSLHNRCLLWTALPCSIGILLATLPQNSSAPQSILGPSLSPTMRSHQVKHPVVLPPTGAPPPRLLCPH